jgi:hypothetical protein
LSYGINHDGSSPDKKRKQAAFQVEGSAVAKTLRLGDFGGQGAHNGERGGRTKRD